MHSYLNMSDPATNCHRCLRSLKLKVIAKFPYFQPTTEIRRITFRILENDDTEIVAGPEIIFEDVDTVAGLVTEAGAAPSDIPPTISTDPVFQAGSTILPESLYSIRKYLDK